ncbi:MAG TPA: BON domain-containing protein [Pyrinomonadaceae bacterium]|jgi:hypothetical protein
MNRQLMFGLGVGLGTAGMFLLDPARGKRRRALVRDKVAYVKRKTTDGIETTAHDLKNRARGLKASVQSRFASGNVDDGVLVDRVRAKLGRTVSHPAAIEVKAENGKITLSGPILQNEESHLLSCVKWIPGVKEVNNQLEAHSATENHPALQGGRQRPGYHFEFFQEHWSPAARFLAGAAGASLAVYGGSRRDAVGTGLGAAGLLLLTRGITNTEFKRLPELLEGSKKHEDQTAAGQNVSRVENYSQTSPTM